MEIIRIAGALVTGIIVVILFLILAVRSYRNMDM